MIFIRKAKFQVNKNLFHLLGVLVSNFRQLNVLLHRINDVIKTHKNAFINKTSCLIQANGKIAIL